MFAGNANSRGVGGRDQLHTPGGTATATSSHSDDAAFSVRVVYMDHYMGPALFASNFGGGAAKPCLRGQVGAGMQAVPVIRIYGSTPRGQKCCVHVHGFLPYFYVLLPDNLTRNADSAENAKTGFTRSLQDALMQDTHTLNANPNTNNRTPRRKSQPCVAKVAWATGIQFYGFHSTAQDKFIKVELFDPKDITRAAAFCRSGKILETVLGVFEVHVAYHTRFFVEHGLAGMAYLNLSHFTFRAPLPISPPVVRMEQALWYPKSQKNPQQQDSNEEASSAHATSGWSASSASTSHSSRFPSGTVRSPGSFTASPRPPSAVIHRQEDHDVHIDTTKLTDDEQRDRVCPTLWLESDTAKSHAHLIMGTESVHQHVELTGFARAKWDTWQASLTFPARTTTCELEIDIHASNIIMHSTTSSLKQLTCTSRTQQQHTNSHGVRHVHSLIRWWEQDAERKRQQAAQAAVANTPRPVPLFTNPDGDDAVTNASEIISHSPSMKDDRDDCFPSTPRQDAMRQMLKKALVQYSESRDKHLSPPHVSPHIKNEERNNMLMFERDAGGQEEEEEEDGSQMFASVNTPSTAQVHDDMLAGASASAGSFLPGSQSQSQSQVEGEEGNNESGGSIEHDRAPESHQGGTKFIPAIQTNSNINDLQSAHDSINTHYASQGLSMVGRTTIHQQPALGLETGGGGNTSRNGSLGGSGSTDTLLRQGINGEHMEVQVEEQNQFELGFGQDMELVEDMDDYTGYDDDEDNDHRDESDGESSVDDVDDQGYARASQEQQKQHRLIMSQRRDILTPREQLGYTNKQVNEEDVDDGSSMLLDREWGAIHESQVQSQGYPQDDDNYAVGNDNYAVQTNNSKAENDQHQRLYPSEGNIFETWYQDQDNRAADVEEEEEEEENDDDAFMNNAGQPSANAPNHVDADGRDIERTAWPRMSQTDGPPAAAAAAAAAAATTTLNISTSRKAKALSLSSRVASSSSARAITRTAKRIRYEEAETGASMSTDKSGNEVGIEAEEEEGEWKEVIGPEERANAGGETEKERKTERGIQVDKKVVNPKRAESNSDSDWEDVAGPALPLLEVSSQDVETNANIDADIIDVASGGSQDVDNSGWNASDNRASSGESNCHKHERTQQKRRQEYQNDELTQVQEKQHRLHDERAQRQAIQLDQVGDNHRDDEVTQRQVRQQHVDDDQVSRSAVYMEVDHNSVEEEATGDWGNNSEHTIVRVNVTVSTARSPSQIEIHSTDTPSHSTMPSSVSFVPGTQTDSQQIDSQQQQQQQWEHTNNTHGLNPKSTPARRVGGRVRTVFGLSIIPESPPISPALTDKEQTSTSHNNTTTKGLPQAGRDNNEADINLPQSSDSNDKQGVGKRRTDGASCGAGVVLDLAGQFATETEDSTNRSTSRSSDQDSASSSAVVVFHDTAQSKGTAKLSPTPNSPLGIERHDDRSQGTVRGQTSGGGVYGYDSKDTILHSQQSNAINNNVNNSNNNNNNNSSDDDDDDDCDDDSQIDSDYSDNSILNYTESEKALAHNHETGKMDVEHVHYRHHHHHHQESPQHQHRVLPDKGLSPPSPSDVAIQVPMVHQGPFFSRDEDIPRERSVVDAIGARDSNFVRPVGVGVKWTSEAHVWPRGSGTDGNGFIGSGNKLKQRQPPGCSILRVLEPRQSPPPPQQVAKQVPNSIFSSNVPRMPTLTPIAKRTNVRRAGIGFQQSNRVIPQVILPANINIRTNAPVASQLIVPMQTPHSSVKKKNNNKKTNLLKLGSGEDMRPPKTNGFMHISHANRANQHLTTMSLEIHATSRPRTTVFTAHAQSSDPRECLLPDPQRDQLRMIAYVVRDDDADVRAFHLAVEEGKAKPGDVPTGMGDMAGVIVVGDYRAATNGDNTAAATNTTINETTPLPDDNNNNKNNNNLANLNSHHRVIERGDAGPKLVEPTIDHLRTIGTALNELPNSNVVTRVVQTEIELFEAFVALVRSVDPDVLVGYEVQKESLGYMLERAANLQIPLARALSRAVWGTQDRRHGNDEFNAAEQSDIWVTGRMVINVWRVMRKDEKLPIYAFERVVQELLGKTFPKYSAGVLSKWFESPQHRWRTARHIVRRAATVLALMDRQDTLGRTSELARFFGMDFFSVLTRGSQFRVEAVLTRVAKPFGYMMPSPSKREVASQQAMEEIALILEPRSRLYTGPVLVLDFRSLYPSVIIAYNLCFSTCIGRLKQNEKFMQVAVNATTKGTPPRDRDSTNLNKDGSGGNGSIDESNGSIGDDDNEKNSLLKLQELFRPNLGVLKGHGLSTDILETANDLVQLAADLIVSPTGAVFVPPHVRQGILPTMLSEILATRIMVKDAMKEAKAAGDKVMHRILDARQLGLKMIANVTYGYTAAGYSGRMPCAEIADAIVRIGRETLLRAMEIAKAMGKTHASSWGRMEVVYGDTDSLFVHMPDCSLKQAFEIGQQIAQEVTKANPDPVKLQFEKAYMPCMLVTKKRYVGMRYETVTEVESGTPHFEAKGIEVVRRDTCSLVAKLMEGSLRTLFTTKDLSLVKSYLQNQFRKINAGRVPLSEYVLSSKVRLGQYAADRKGSNAHPPPSAVVAKRRMVLDPRSRPLYKQRVPFVVVFGPPKSNLVDLVVHPHDYYSDPGMRINTVYYVTKKVLPALNRLFALVGVRLDEWYTSLPAGKMRTRSFAKVVTGGGSAGGSGSVYGVRNVKRRTNTMDTYLKANPCSVCRQLTVCRQPTQYPICESCRSSPQRCYLALARRVQETNASMGRLKRMCLSCSSGGEAHTGAPEFMACCALQCAVYHRRQVIGSYLEGVAVFQNELSNTLQ